MKAEQLRLRHVPSSLFDLLLFFFSSVLFLPLYYSAFRDRIKATERSPAPQPYLMFLWLYTRNDNKRDRITDKKKAERSPHLSTKNSPAKYTEEFKKTIVSLYQSGKTYAQIQKEYSVSSSALFNWIRKYSQVKVDDDTLLSAQQIKALQKRNAELKMENRILKKRLQSSRHTQKEIKHYRCPVPSAFCPHPLSGARY